MKTFAFRLIQAVNLLTLFVCLPKQYVYAAEAWERVEATGELRWGGDAAGGAPYVFPNPENPAVMIGFEIEMLIVTHEAAFIEGMATRLVKFGAQCRIESDQRLKISAKV